MFGKNEIVGKKYFQQAEQGIYNNPLLVTSIFFTIQGEGPFRGQPAMFLRLAKCNLQCSFCDTYFDSGNWMTTEEILDHMEKLFNEFFFKRGYSEKDIPYSMNDVILVVTGGEPMLQTNLVEFLRDIEADLIFESVQIESNGLIHQEIPDFVYLVVSPKCLEKNGKAIRYLEPNKKILKRLDYLKFVMEADPNSPYSKIPEWALELRRDVPIFVSPMNIYNDEPQSSKIARAEKTGISLEERSEIDERISFWTPDLLNLEQNQKNHEYAAEYAMKHNLIFQVQLHLFASLA